MTNQSTQHIYESNKEIINYLKESRLFGHLPEDMLTKLVPVSGFKSFKAEDPILLEGQSNSQVYFLIRIGDLISITE